MLEHVAPVGGIGIGLQGPGLDGRNLGPRVAEEPDELLVEKQHRARPVEPVDGHRDREVFEEPAEVVADAVEVLEFDALRWCHRVNLSGS